MDDEEMLHTLAWIASTYRHQGRWTEAEKLFVQVIETSKTALGPEHPSTLTSMANLASTYRNQGRWTEAEKLEVQVIETRKTALGPEHPDTLASMWNLSHPWKKQGRNSHALGLLEAYVQLQRKRLGPTHPHAIAATVELEAWERSSDLAFSDPPADTSDSQPDANTSTTLIPTAQVEYSRSMIHHHSQATYVRTGILSIHHPLLSALRSSGQAVESIYDDGHYDID